MAFMISKDAGSFTCGAGEPIVFSYSPRDGSGDPEDLTGRRFVWALYTVSNGVRQEVGYYDGQVGDRVVWALPGTFSNSLYGISNLLWDLVERDHMGRETIKTGTLTITATAPRIDDLDGAPISRYIHQISRLNDPSTEDYPVFAVSTALYHPEVAVVTPTPTPTPAFSPSMDFSKAENSMYLALGL